LGDFLQRWSVFCDGGLRSDSCTGVGQTDGTVNACRQRLQHPCIY